MFPVVASLSQNMKLHHLRLKLHHLAAKLPHLAAKVPHLKSKLPHLAAKVPHLMVKLPHLVPLCRTEWQRREAACQQRRKVPDVGEFSGTAFAVEPVDDFAADVGATPSSKLPDMSSTASGGL